VTKLLLCGLSGAGKTTVGDRLAGLGWSHFDCEKVNPKRWADRRLPAMPKAQNLVASWGFLPRSIDMIQIFLGLGYVPVWLWGERKFLDAALRERGEVESFINSPDRVEQEGALALITPDMVINTFRPNGSRWNVAAALHDAYWEEPDRG